MPAATGNPRVRDALRIIFVALALTQAGCDTDAVGIETCRSIEQARCQAAASCGMIDDVEACQRFARDHCLHGVALDEDPSSVAVDRCVDAIELAGRCAERHGVDSNPLECREDGFFGTRVEDICEAVQEPELMPRCDFLAPEEEEPEPAPDPDDDAGAD